MNRNNPFFKASAPIAKESKVQRLERIDVIEEQPQYSTGAVCHDKRGRTVYAYRKRKVNFKEEQYRCLLVPLSLLCILVCPFYRLRPVTTN